jgi:hypothetical protein
MWQFAALAGLQLAGSYFAAKNIRDTAELNRDIADMNAKFAELDAYDARIEGYSNVAKYQSVIDKTLSEQQLALTAADVDVSYGSVGTIKEENSTIAELNKMEILKEAQEKASGFKTQARQYRLGGEQNRIQSYRQANQTMTQGLLGAAQTTLSGYKK